MWAPRPQPAAAWSLALGARPDLCRPGMVASSLAGAPPFPVAKVVSLFHSAEGWGSGVGHLPGVQAGPVRQYILGSGRRRRRRRWRRRQGEASSGSSSPAPRSLAVLEGPWRPQRDIIRTNSAVGAGGMGGGGEKAAVRVQDTAPHLPQIDASLPVCGHHL